MCSVLSNGMVNPTLTSHVGEYEMMCHGPYSDKETSGRNEALTWRVGRRGESSHATGIAFRED